MTDPSQRQPGDSPSEEFARLQRDLAQSRIPSVEEQINQLDEELEGLVTDTAAVTMPAVRDGVTLRDYAPRLDYCRILENEQELVIADYTWHKEEHFNQVYSWLKACVAAQASNLPYRFFVDHAVDMYNFDRALRMSEGLSERLATSLRQTLAPYPRRYDDLPQSMLRRGRDYKLMRTAFVWSSDVPVGATDIIAALVTETPPDSFWIAKYYDAGYIYDPIIYAEFGEANDKKAWQVEVARWGDER